jgi:transcriptional regulator with XRE-family HTH domain
MTKVTGGIVMGNQIKAARSLLGWTQHELADAARVHSNAVAYWEQAVAIPTGRHQPHACRKMAEALHRSGIEFFGHAKPGVRLVQNHNYCGRPPSRARARHGVKHLLSGVGFRLDSETMPFASRPRKPPCRRCGATTRAGAPCQRKALANGRCRNHGGASTGPTTPAGRKRIAEVQQRRWAEWRAQRCTDSVEHHEP